MLAQQDFIVGRGAWTLARKVLFFETVEQFEQGWRFAIGLDIAQRIAASVDRLAQATCLPCAPLQRSNSGIAQSCNAVRDRCREPDSSK